MKIALRLLILLPALAAVAPAAENKTPVPLGAEASKAHPLKGVVMAIDADQSALRVKHEDIPGVMRAMTMQFKVAPATLKAVKTGDAITGMLSRQGNEWWLQDVKVVAAKKS